MSGGAGLKPDGQLRNHKFLRAQALKGMPPRKKIRKHANEDGSLDSFHKVEVVDEVVMRLPTVLLGIVDQYADPAAMIRVLSEMVEKWYNAMCDELACICFRKYHTVDTMRCTFDMAEWRDPGWLNPSATSCLREYLTKPLNVAVEVLRHQLIPLNNFTLDLVYFREGERPSDRPLMKRPFLLIDFDGKAAEKVQKRTERGIYDEEEGWVKHRAIVSRVHHELLVGDSVFEVLKSPPLGVEGDCISFHMLAYMQQHLLKPAARRLATEAWYLL